MGNERNVRKVLDMILQRDRAKEEMELLESAIQRFLQIHFDETSSNSVGDDS
jgi:hypothetical protein